MILPARDLGDIKQASLDMAAAHKILGYLHKHFPGYPWAVKVLKGRCNIKNMATSGQDGYALNFDTQEWSESNLEHAVVMAGGEVLERFGLRRARVNGEEIAELKEDRCGRILQC